MFVQSPSVPIVDIQVEFDAGARRDPVGKAGTASLTNAMLARGIKEVATPQLEPALSEAELSDAIADTGAQFGSEAGEDRAGLSLRSLSRPKDRDRAVLLLARVLAHPSFPQPLFERDKARSIAALKEELTQPDAIASRAFWNLLYGNHPYGMVPTVETLLGITREDLVEFHRIHYVANQAIVSIVGDINKEEADRLARQLTSRLPQGAPLPEILPAPFATGEEVAIPHPASQSHIMIGMPALERTDPDYFALIVGNYILGGGGFVSRLMQEVRENRGLAYSVASYFMPLEKQGPFQIGLQTQTERAAEALKIVRETVARFIETGPQPKEVFAAKDNMISGFPLRIDTNNKILENLAVIGFYNLPLDYLEKWPAKVASVTAQEIQAAFKRKIEINRLETVIVGGPGKLAAR